MYKVWPVPKVNEGYIHVISKLTKHRKQNVIKVIKTSINTINAENSHSVGS
jgi:hypothetical protein